MIQLFEYPIFKFFTVKKPLICENRTLPEGTKIFIRRMETADGKVVGRENCDSEDAKYAVIYFIDPADKHGFAIDVFLAQRIEDRVCLGQAHFSIEAMNAWINEWLIPDENATLCFEEYDSNLRTRSLIESGRNHVIENLIEACSWLGTALLSLIIAVLLPVKVNALLLSLPIILVLSPITIITKGKINKKIYNKSLIAKSNKLKEAKLRHLLEFEHTDFSYDSKYDCTLGKWVIKDGVPTFEEESA